MRADRVPKYGQILRLLAPCSHEFRLVAPAERLTSLGVAGVWPTCECTLMRVNFFATQHRIGSAMEYPQRHAVGSKARSFRQTRALVRSDLYRYAGDVRFASFLRHYLFTPGFKYSAVMRLCGYLREGRLRRWLLYPPFKLLLLRYRYKYGIAIPEYTRIGPGLFINRFGGVMVNGDAIIGANCNITHGAMLGQLNRGPRTGSPVLGDEVFLAAGCKVIGRIRIGDRAAVGANAVVTKDVPDDGVVGGIPAKLLSTQGSEGYINRRVSPDCANGFRPLD